MHFNGIILFLFLLFFACNNTSEDKSVNSQSVAKTEYKESIPKTENLFDKTKWNTKKGKDYPYRDEVLDDVMHDQHLREIKWDSIIVLLGQPDKVDSSYLFYRVAEKRIGFFTLHDKTLVIKMSPDSTITWMKIHQ